MKRTVILLLAAALALRGAGMARRKSGHSWKVIACIIVLVMIMLNTFCSMTSREGMSALGFSELVKAIEDNFGISAVAAATVEEEETGFDVIYKAPGNNRITVIKVVREITGLGLKAAQEVVDNPPKLIKEGISKEEAEEIKNKLVEAGAEVEIHPSPSGE